MNRYEERQERRRGRLEERADRAEAASSAHFARGQDMAQMMNGQPVLIGHHSEKRHRRDIERMDSSFRRGCEEHENAEEFRRRADAVGHGGISSDDEDAITKLTAKLKKLEEQRDLMKRLNAAWRKAGKPSADDKEGWAKVEAQGFSSAFVMHRRQDMARDFMVRAPYTYNLTNLGGNIRRIKERIKQLEQEAEALDWPGIKGEGYEFEAYTTENRVLCYFDSKPPREVCRIMRSHGWRWNRTLGAWSRMLNAAGRRSAKILHAGYSAEPGEGPLPKAMKEGVA